MMAEGLSHRLNEYLRNGQTNEEMNSIDYTATLHANQEGAFKKNLNWDGQRSQSHDRRSSLTSFADLYERAVRNVLSIRPLFDSPIDIFGQRRPDGNSQGLPVPQQQHQPSSTRKNRIEKDLQQEPGNHEKESPERRNSIKRENTRTVQSDYLTSGNEQSASRFFTHALTEQMRQNLPRTHPSPTVPPHRPVFSADQAEVPNQNTGSISTGHLMGQNRNLSRNNSYYDRVHEGYRRYWSQYAGQHNRHKPGMLDSLKHTPHHRIESQSNFHQTNFAETDLRDDRVKTDHDNQHNEEILEKIDHKTDQKDNQRSDVTNVGFKNLSATEMDKFKERARENARLKYRPYSLRSKKNGLRKSFGRSKRRNKKNKKEIAKKNTWQPESTQEVFLFRLGLMRKSSKVMSINDSTSKVERIDVGVKTSIK